jgi:hypothetical protein
MRIQKYFFITLLIFCASSFFGLLFNWHNSRMPNEGGDNSSSEINFENSFKNGEILEESGKIKNSTNADWWLNSGAMASFSNGIFKTNIGSLPAGSAWQKLYAKNNPLDTQDGFLPQNIFRLVEKGSWKNFSQEVYFQIDAVNSTESPQRNESNGVLLFNRYLDGDNLYYAGVRVDGDAVIKKKLKGKYYTLAEKPIFSNGNEYDHENEANLIPEHQWIGIRCEVKETQNDGVDLKLSIDEKDNGQWKLVLEVEDSGGRFGKKPIIEAGHAGIRSDFMDVSFRNYKILENE